MVPPVSVLIAEIRYRMIEAVPVGASTRFESCVGTNVVAGMQALSSAPQWSIWLSQRMFWLPSPGLLKAWVSRHCSTRRQVLVPVATSVVIADSFFWVKYVGANKPGQLLPPQTRSTGTSGQLFAFAA